MTFAKVSRATILAALMSTVALGAQARELRMGVITPPSHVWTKVANRIAEKLPEATEGGLTLAVFPAGQLGSEQEMFQQMSAGLLDAGLMTAAITSLRAPSMQGWFTPYLFADVGEAVQASSLPAAQAMLDELQAANLHGMGYTFAGMRQILMKDAAAQSVADLSGQKIRIVPFPAMKVWWGAIDAVPTPVNLTEVYQALQTGLLDGIDIDLDALVGLKFDEVAKGLTVTNHMAFPSVMMVSNPTWMSLSSEEQAAFTAVVDEALAWGADQQVEAEKANLAALEGKLEIVHLADGAAVFAAANDAVAQSFAQYPLIAQFQAEVTAEQGK
ncbi:TRAP-type C4-dicarboxylate transport system substrate-binding protein [Rhodobacter sp. JA431]|uniref:TRAP transporter substrate-binding protein n=1 Tax=Rhodobacter sp. JA431 TaxID=570013 RepID=UPI000BC510D7|nr:TRAP transporter substrate-binding protein [Rhodobacter sp. JA431]SOB99979.1 TRAP-type C4-dicarboxylate transport system substrate-binding protein [Rhodobacter sp. JA431]